MYNHVIIPPSVVTDVSLAVQQYSRTKLMNVSPSVLDIVCKQLDPGGEGLKTWEDFGEALLGLTVVEVREFRGYRPSPTRAIIDRKMGSDPDATLSDVMDVLKKIGRREVVRLVEAKISNLPPPPPLAKQSSNHSTQPVTREFSLPRNRHVPHQGSSSLDSGYDPTEERDTTEPQPVASQHSTYQSFISRSQSTESESSNSYRVAPISGTGELSTDFPSVSDSAHSGSLEPWEPGLPRPQVAASIGHRPPSLSQVVTGSGVTDPRVEYDHYRSSQPQSLVMPAQQPSAKVMGKR